MIVVPKTSASDESSWFGLAKYAWSGYVQSKADRTVLTGKFCVGVPLNIQSIYLQPKAL